jgi:hypothetical protein
MTMTAINLIGQSVNPRHVFLDARDLMALRMGQSEGVTRTSRTATSSRRW